MSDDKSPTDLKTQLQDDLAMVEWKSLEMHIKEDRLIIVDSELDLIEVAIAVIEDNTSKVQELIHCGKLRKPAIEEIELWAQLPDKEIFKVLIAQPYVLTQVESFSQDLN